MKRTSYGTVALLLLLTGVGCCYTPGYVNRYNGIAYGGHWSAMPGGPFDPCCATTSWCAAPGADDCCNVCEPPCFTPISGSYGIGCTDGCGTGYGGMVPQTFAPQPREMPQGETVPGGGMQPVPDPNMNKTPMKSGATTYVMPQQLPFVHQPGIHQTSNTPWVQAR